MIDQPNWVGCIAALLGVILVLAIILVAFISKEFGGPDLWSLVKGTIIAAIWIGVGVFIGRKSVDW